MAVDLLAYAPELLVICATFAVVRYFLSYRRWEKIAMVQKLYIYPLKSGRPMTPEMLHCSQYGVRIPNSTVRDRCFMAVQANGNVCRAVLAPNLVLVTFELFDGKAKAQAPGMDTIMFKVPSLTDDTSTQKTYGLLGCTVPGIDCGDEAAAWFEKYTGIDGVRLVYHDEKMDYKEKSKLCDYKDLDVYNKKPIATEFQNWTPVNILSQESIDDLNLKLHHKLEVSERNFRPNILVSECPAYAEDKWRRIKIGSAELVFARLCARCPLPTVSPLTGIKHPEQEPLATLKKYRLLTEPAQRELYGPNPVFSSEYVVAKEGDFRVGDIVYGIK